jgi:DNA-binding IclR family transcriptional regulator
MSDATDKTPSAQVLRALDMLEALSGHVVNGLSNKDLAEALRVPPSYVTRTAEQLINKGWVEKDEASGRFRITTRFSRLTFRVLDSFERAKAELDARQRNYTLTN